MKSNVIVVDIDNTLLTQNKRKQIILKSLFNKDVSISEIVEDFSLNNILEKIAKERNSDSMEVKNTFSKEFFGENFNEPENFICIEQSAYYLRLLAQKAKIIYLSARDYRLKDATEQQLKYFGFPEVDGNNVELFVMPNTLCPDEWTGKFLDNFDNISLKFKQEKLSELKGYYNIVAGIGDSFSDLNAYYSNGIVSAILKFGKSNIDEFIKNYNLKTDNKIDKYSYIVLDSWPEIYWYVLSIISDDSLREICKQHSNDYSKWMFDLDNKAYLILVAATFCVTSLISLMGKSLFESFLSKVVFFIGIITSTFSMYFAIQAFASRNTHITKDSKVNKVGLKRLFELIRYFFPVLCGKFPACTKAFEDVYSSDLNKKEVNESKFAEFAYLKYFKERYKILNPDVIISKTLINLRDSNYKKILSERYARIFLNITLCVIVIVVAAYLWKDAKFFVDSAKQLNDDVYAITEVSNQQVILELDDSCFDEEAMALTQIGEKKLLKACKNVREKYIVCKIVSEKNHLNDKVRHYFNSIKFELIKDYVRNVFREKEVVLIVK